MLDDAEIADRVDFHGNGVGELAHPVLAVNVRGQKTGVRNGGIQIFDDGERLCQRLAVDDDRRQQPLRVELEIVVFEVGARQQVDRTVVGFETQKIERDAHAVARGRTPVIIKNNVFCHQTLPDTQCA